MKERNVNMVVNSQLYLKGLVEKDLFSDEQELIHVEGKLSLEFDNAYLRGRKEFLKDQIEKKKNILENIDVYSKG